MSEQIQAEQTTNTSQEAGKREADTGKAGPEASGSAADNILQSQQNGVNIPDRERGRITATAQFAFQGQAVRTILKDGETWFVAADVCTVLEHTNSRVAVSRLDDDEKGVSSVYTLGGGQETTVVNESGLYNLIFTSRKPQAKAFRRWVTSEVLPSIRATGRYDAAGDPQAAIEEQGRQTLELLRALVALLTPKEGGREGPSLEDLLTTIIMQGREQIGILKTIQEEQIRVADTLPQAVADAVLERLGPTRHARS